jgi:hypothetical protein
MAGVDLVLIAILTETSGFSSGQRTAAGEFHYSPPHGNKAGTEAEKANRGSNFFTA